jgi:hypothetical protein
LPTATTKRLSPVASNAGCCATKARTASPWQQQSIFLIDEFCDTLWLEHGLAKNSLDAYRRDLRLFARWLESSVPARGLHRSRRRTWPPISPTATRHQAQHGQPAAVGAQAFLPAGAAPNATSRPIPA